MKCKEWRQNTMYVCRRMKLCAFLLSKGFSYERKESDKFNPKHSIWIFKSSPELMLAIEDYYSQVK